MGFNTARVVETGEGDIFGTIAGEFAPVGGPYITSIPSYGTSVFPADCFNLLPGVPQPRLPFGLTEMIKIILTENGRYELFTNPFSAQVSAIAGQITAAGNIAGVDVSSALTSLQTSLSNANEHLNRICGVVEDFNTNLPTLDKILGVGAAMQMYSQSIDMSRTNLAFMSMFGSIAVAGSALGQLNSMLSNPSSLVPTSLMGFGASLDAAMQSDVNSYFIALKKLRRIGLVNLVFGGATNQAQKCLIDTIGTPATQYYVTQTQLSGNTVPTPIVGVPVHVPLPSVTVEGGPEYPTYNIPVPPAGSRIFTAPNPMTFTSPSNYTGPSYGPSAPSPRGGNGQIKFEVWGAAAGNGMQISSFKFTVPTVFPRGLDITHIGTIKITESPDTPVVFRQVTITRQPYDMSSGHYIAEGLENPSTGPGFYFTYNNPNPPPGALNFNSGDVFYVNVRNSVNEHTSSVPAGFTEAPFLIEFASPERY